MFESVVMVLQCINYHLSMIFMASCSQTDLKFLVLIAGLVNLKDFASHTLENMVWILLQNLCRTGRQSKSSKCYMRSPDSPSLFFLHLLPCCAVATLLICGSHITVWALTATKMSNGFLPHSSQQ